MDLPENISNFIHARKANDIPPNICDTCNSSCCKGPGFALFENIVYIYNLYTLNHLQRNNYSFETNLSLESFIYKYFDRVLFNGSLLAFFPKILSENNELISVPPWNYYQSRDYIYKRKSNFGCIFLENNWDSDNINNHCILHSNNLYSEITQKPIDCVFLMCSSTNSIIKPTNRESNLWISLLDYYFPNSFENFKQLFPSISD